MELTKEMLEALLQGYKQSAEQHRTDAIANNGAAQAIEQLLKMLSTTEVVDKED